MSTPEPEIKRWTAKLKTQLVLEILLERPPQALGYQAPSEVMAIAAQVVQKLRGHYKSSIKVAALRAMGSSRWASR